MPSPVGRNFWRPTFCHLLDSIRYNREQGDRALVDHPVFIAVREGASSEEVEDLASGRIVVDHEF